MRCYYANQHGAVLIMTMILLFVVILVSASFASISSLELRGAKNYSDRLATLAIAENALYDAEAAIEALPDPDDRTMDATVGFYTANTEPDPFDDDTWDGAGILANSDADTTAAFYVEKIETVNSGESGNPIDVGLSGYGEDVTPFGADITVFRSIVRSQNDTGTAVFMLESFYDRAF